MDRRSKVVVALSLVALVTLALGSWAADAHTQTYKTNLAVHFDKKSSSLWGHVGTASFCQEGRQIDVFMIGSGSDTFVGTAFSGQGGMWGPVSALGSGSYYAKVDERHESGYGHDHTCLPDISGSIRVT
jgi:hypothetical protein